MKRGVLAVGRVLGLCLFVSGMVVLAGCQAKPDEVATQLAEALNAQDLEAALALFAEDAVVDSASPEPFTGKAEIQGWLEGMFADNFKVEIEIVEVNGDTVVGRDRITMDSLIPLGISSLEGTSETAVRGGKITALNFAFTEESLAKLPSPISTAQDLVGIWHQTPTNSFLGELYIQYKEDGTCRSATGTADRLESHPLVEGEYWFEGGQVLSKDTGGVPPWDECVEPGTIGKYEVWMYTTGNIRLVRIEDECSGRAMVMPGEYEPVP
jgi:hypothetical protein